VTVTADPGGIKMSRLHANKKGSTVALRPRFGFRCPPGFARDQRAV
jgi:hypothetical protein